MPSLDESFDPWADAHVDDPLRAYALMRDQDPVHWNHHRQMWFVTRYSDVVKVLSDRASFSAAVWQKERPHMEAGPSVGARDFVDVGSTMMTEEPPEHTRLRRPANPHFSWNSLHEREASIARISDRLLDAVAGRDEWDLIRDYAFPLPALVMADLLGIPEEDQDEFMSLVSADNAALAIDPRATREVLDHYASMGKEMAAFLERVVEEKRRKPLGDDLTSVLIREEAAGGYSTSELLATVQFMVEAGYVTTVNLLGNGMHLLLQDPTRFQALQRDPDLIPSAVEECLRFDGPVHVVGRVATQDAEVDGTHIAPGQVVIALLSAANRDPAKFPDPDTFIIDRSPNPHMTFSAGVHKCIGANLARAEAMVAFRSVAERFPQLTLVADPVRKPTFELRGFEELRVAS